MSEDRFLEGCKEALRLGIEYGKQYIEAFSRTNLSMQPQIFVVRMKDVGDCLIQPIGQNDPTMPWPTGGYLVNELSSMTVVSAIPVCLICVGWGAMGMNSGHSGDPCALVFGVTGREADIKSGWVRHWAPDGPVGSWHEDCEPSYISLYIQAALQLYLADTRLRMSIGMAAKLGNIKFGAADEAA